MPPVIFQPKLKTGLVPDALVAEIATEINPSKVGVPEIKPVAGSKVMPVGNGEAVKDVGVFVPSSCKVVGTPEGES